MVNYNDKKITYIDEIHSLEYIIEVDSLDDAYFSIYDKKNIECLLSVFVAEVDTQLDDIQMQEYLNNLLKDCIKFYITKYLDNIEKHFS